jgi:hypothetical protein
MNCDGWRGDSPAAKRWNLGTGTTRSKGSGPNFGNAMSHPDWLLIYQRTETELVLARIGTHADLFGT